MTGYLKKIKILKAEGYPQDQAVAIALSMRDSGKLAKGGILKSEDHGAAYKLDGDTLMYAPLMDSGKYSDDDWAEVDFNRIDVDLANAIKKETESLYAKGGELFDADTEVEYAKGGMINFNPKDFSLAEIDQYLLDQDIFLQWLAKGDSTSSAFEREMLWDSNRSSTEWNKVKNMRLTMSDYGILEFSKGSENLYFNVVVYDNESSSEIPMNLQMYAKEYEGLDNLKKFASKFVKKLSKGGFIQDAVKDMKKKGTVGAFTAQARKRGLKPVEFAKEVLRSPDEFSETTRKRAQFVKNANPELFNFGGEIVRKYDVNIKSGVGTYAKGGKVEERVYAIDKRYFKSKNTDSLNDENFMDIAEGQGLVWSNMDSFIDSNEYNEQGAEDFLTFRKISVPSYYAKGGEVEDDFKEQTVEFIYKGKKHKFTFTPEDSNEWSAFTSHGIEFDVHYDEDYNHIVVYEYFKELEDQPYETIHKQKIYAKGGNVKKKDDLVEILTRVKEEEGQSDMYYDLQMKLVAYGDNPSVARKEFMSVLENYDVRPQYYLGEDNDDDYDVMGSFDEEGDLI